MASPLSSLTTHTVSNQPPPLTQRNLFTDNQPLLDCAKRLIHPEHQQELISFGKVWGDEEVIKWGRQANENPPKLHTFNRYGQRIDEVEFHPAWHSLMSLGVKHKLHALPWLEGEHNAHVRRIAAYMTVHQVEAGFCCPITMTFAALPALVTQPELTATWQPLLTSTSYNPKLEHAEQKGSALCGMAMTEKQGGSDVRANTTVAQPLGSGGAGEEYLLTGHKWFCSAPMCDVFLVLAQAKDGLSCFLVPRVQKDGTRNPFFIQRLKDKLGNRSNASSEVEFQDTWAQMVGEPGRGVATIIEMVSHTRLDVAAGAAGLMRLGVANATWHAAHRTAFGQELAKQPAMVNTLADLCLESEAATFMVMQLAALYDEEATQPGLTTFKRLMTAVAKYWLTKRLPQHAYECMEVLGGVGYVEESGMPRLYKEAPLGSIWEGSGNIMALDVLRTLKKFPDVLEIFFAETQQVAGANTNFDEYVHSLKNLLTQDAAIQEFHARQIVEKLALSWQGSILLKHSSPEIADTFCAARLDSQRGHAYGTLAHRGSLENLIARHQPPKD